MLVAFTFANQSGERSEQGSDSSSEAASGSADLTSGSADVNSAGSDCVALSPDDDAQSVVDDAGSGATICLTSGTFVGFSVRPHDGQHFVGASTGAGVEGLSSVLDGGGETAHAFYSDAERAASDVTIEAVEARGYRSPITCGDLTGLEECLDAPVRGGAVVPFVQPADGDPPVRADVEASSSGWRLMGSYLHDNEGSAVAVAPGMEIVGNTIADNTHLGIGGGGVADVVIQANDFHNNGTDDRIPIYWEVGQIKLAHVLDVVISENTFESGTGPAIWCDIACEQVDIVDNTIRDMDSNRAVGIFYEVSRGGTISGNDITGSFGRCTMQDGIAILIGESQSTTVTNNVIHEVGNFVVVRQVNWDLFEAETDYWRSVVGPDVDEMWRLVDVDVRANEMWNNEARCEEAPWGRVAIDTRDRGDHPNTVSPEEGVTFADNDYGPDPDQVTFWYGPTGQAIDFEGWESVGQG